MKEVIIPILNNEYKVIFTWGSVKEITKVVKSWGYKKADVVHDVQNRRGLCYKSGLRVPIIAMPSFPKSAEEIGTLSHEAVHAIDHIFEQIDEQYKDEVFAHSVGAVVRTVLSFKKLKEKK